jgi:pyruvate-formate lyase
MHLNDVDYWRYLQSLPRTHPDLPSPRVCRLLLKLFEGWREKPRWIEEDQVGHLFRGRNDLTSAEKKRLAGLPIEIRKSLAIQRMLQVIVNPAIAETAGSCSVNADELIIGTLPPFSVGQGKEFVRYLTEAEELRGALDYLNELSPMGHIVPNHQVVMEKGLEGLIAECKQRSRKATKEQKIFYEAVALTLQSVIDYATAYGSRARKLASTLSSEDPNKQSLSEVAANLLSSPAKPPRSFHQAVQAIYIMHCALHWTVEVVPIGRLDQLLLPFYRDDIRSEKLTPEKAQEIIDCLWIKLDERVILNPRHAEDRFTPADGVLTGFWGSSNFDQGGLLNQWMQQITIGGIKATDDPEPEDASNPVTFLCLEAARRLPLNSPTLDLRLHAGSPRAVIEAAAKTLLSGGAHPVLLNDERIIAGLSRHAGVQVPLSSARNYACDGCYETMFAGETEFSFGFIPALDVLEKALNRGAGIGASGAIHLRGQKDSWRTKPASQITTFAELWEILREHIKMGCHRYLHNLLTFYGNKGGIAPSPLLSALISGCLEKGQDLVNGGARYHIFAPLMVGISTAADSLYAIRQLVFETRQVALDELVSCLTTNWGSALLPIAGRQSPAYGTQVSAARIKEIRQLSMELPKFGNGNIEVDRIAWDLINVFCDCVQEVRHDPVHAPEFERLKRFESNGHPFVLILTPGVGTFEQYVFSGSFIGASADGRPAGAPIGSDLSPAPIHPDQPATVATSHGLRHARIYGLEQGLKSYANDCMNRLGDGAPADYNIGENYPESALANAIEAFARGEGGSVCTFTVADPETFAKAQQNPEACNLVRVRMGGWTEFFITLFPAHQEQHKRRPLYQV